MGLTLLGLLFLYKYYDSMIAIKRLSGICLQPGVTYSSLRGAGLLSAFAWDVLIMLPIPLPGVDFTITVWNKGLGRSSDYTSDTVLCVICMFLRVSYLPRFYGECLSDLHGSASVAFARFNRIKLNETFTIKYVLANSLECVMFISGLSVVMFAYAMMIFERPVGEATLGHYRYEGGTACYPVGGVLEIDGFFFVGLLQQLRVAHRDYNDNGRVWRRVSDDLSRTARVHHGVDRCRRDACHHRQPCHQQVVPLPH